MGGDAMRPGSITKVTYIFRLIFCDYYLFQGRDLRVPRGAEGPGPLRPGQRGADRELAARGQLHHRPRGREACRGHLLLHGTGQTHRGDNNVCHTQG